MGGVPGDSDGGDSDLEAELAALAGGGSGSKPAKKALTFFHYFKVVTIFFFIDCQTTFAST